MALTCTCRVSARDDASPARRVGRYGRAVDAADEPEFDDFICTCDDDRRDRAAALREEVRQRIAAGSDERAPHEVTAESFVTDLIWSLNWDFNVHITEIACDQWFGIWAETYDRTFKTRIQCDSVEDGLAATWRAFADRPSPLKFDSQ